MKTHKLGKYLSKEVEEKENKSCGTIRMFHVSLRRTGVVLFWMEYSINTKLE